MSKILVIGAGVGGATAAALLAKAGHQVTVLEAHVYAGGCAGTFYHQGYRFDAGATLAGGFQPGGPHDMVGEALGITWPIVTAEPAWRVHLPDRTITRWGGEARWRDALGEATRDLPDQRAILSFFRETERISDAVWAFAGRRPAWPPAGLADLLKDTFESTNLIKLSCVLPSKPPRAPYQIVRTVIKMVPIKIYRRPK